MEKTTNHKKTFGLIGKNINYSFSKKYFNEKFEKENILATYENFDCQNIHEVQHILNLNSVNGFNVTIPYKQSIIPFLDTISETAEQIGAVNCIEINSLGKKIGHNTDWKGFKKSIEPFISNNHQKALILGTGGASKAVKFALEKIGVSTKLVGRTMTVNQFIYEDLNEIILKEHQIIVNTTPLGTFPKVENSPNIPFQFISNQHLVFDLIYNPNETLFLKKAKNQGAQIVNGYEMLVNQAESAWEIWNKNKV